MFLAYDHHPGTKRRDRERPKRVRRAQRAFARDFHPDRVRKVETVIAPLVPQWTLLSPRVRTGLATLALMCFEGAPHRQHRVRDGFMRVTYEELEALWPRSWRWERLDALNGRGRLFELWEPQPGLRGHVKMARGIRLAEGVAERIEQAFYVRVQDWRASPPPPKRGRPPSKGIVEDEHHPLVAWRGLNTAPTVSVDRDGPRALLDSVRAGEVPSHWLGCSAEQFEHRRRALLMFVLEAERGHGTVCVQYHEVSTGRLFAPSSSLQGVPKLVRWAALPSMFEYDMSAAHPTIACAIAPELGVSLPMLASYSSDSGTKEGMRNEIASAVGARYEDVKKCINALVYGASLTHPWGEIRRTLGRDAASRFAEHDFIRSLADEVDGLSVALMAGLRGGLLPRGCRIEAGRLRNAVDCEFDPTKPSEWETDGKASESTVQRRLLAHVIQGYEVLMLREIVREYGSRLVLLQHDGFSAREEIGAAALSRLVEQRTGFRIEFQRIWPK